MQAIRQETYSSPPRVFNHSLDWRFLLPMADLSKGYLLFEEDAEFSQTLEHIGIEASQRLSLSDVRNRKQEIIPFLVMPFGVPVGWAGSRSMDRIEFYSSVRSILETGGFLLVGFNNRMKWRAKPESKYHSSTPHRLTNELKRAGFQFVKIYGAMPDLQIPEYIFELDPQPLRFALQNRFRRKPAVLGALRALDRIIGEKGISHFLPCYFAVATA
jgi:hypothetical protein